MSAALRAAPLRLSPAWRQALPGFALALLGVLLLFRGTGLAMVEIWHRSETFAHAFVVPPLSLWLIWRQRAALARLDPRPALSALLPLALAGLLWLLGELASVNAATQFAFTAMLILLVPATLGWAVARSLAFPLGFLFFAVPFGEFIMPQLMEWTADFTVAALRLSGVPVFREGLQFVIPTGSWSVVEACSGIRYLMASVMVGTLFAYLNYRSLARRWIFVGVAIVLPLAANWMRAYLIVMLGHLSGNKLAAGADHLIYGWAFFGVVMFAMFMIGARWSESDAAPAVSAEVPASSGRPPTQALPAWLPWASALLLLGLLALPQLLVARLAHSSTSQPPQLSARDLVGPGWQQRADAAPQFKPAFEQPAAALQASYAQADGMQVGLYLGYYRHQGFESKLISSNNVLVRSKDPDWAQVSSGHRELALDAGPLPLRTAELRGSALGHGSNEADLQSRLRVWQLYWVNGRVLSQDWQAKLYGALYRLMGQGDDAAVIILYANKAQAGQDDALLQRFVRDNWTQIEASLRAQRDAGLAQGAR
ncbi:exosortase A [Paucibacter oligotrophus]|uniref:Exosortase A n=1 Tax=Roseateles oligotrophus TaxID=1769250 RepID=A0A840LBR6_9BURK|nr:exosortase A [Roseateles oligotrophus]MBB4844133.1 exosortase A [Roseateles oligotrophus]